jgi:hypothetical protein
VKRLKNAAAQFLWYVRTMRTPLNVLFVVAVLAVLLIKFWLASVHELFRGGAKIGELVSALCFAYVTSYVFYFVVQHVKNQRDRDNLYPYIAMWTARIAGDAKAVVSEFKKASGAEFSNEYPLAEQTEAMLKNVSPRKPGPMWIVVNGQAQPGSWVQFLLDRKTRSEGAIRDIYTHIQLLDAEFVRLLVEVQKCSYFGLLDSLVWLPFNNADFSTVSNVFQQYLDRIKALDDYAQMKFERYRAAAGLQL